MPPAAPALGSGRKWAAAALQVKRNVQRTLAVELQRLSVQFRKQQKQYLNRIRSKDGGGGGGPGGSSASLGLLEERGRQADEDYDPGFSDMQVRRCSLMIMKVSCTGL